MPFADAFAFTLAEEGGYVNDPVDRGGATNYGVTQATYDQYRRRAGLTTQPVSRITKAEVELVYRGFWDAGNCEWINQYSSRLALLHFDACINHGSGNALRILQRALNVPSDGLWGPTTRGAVQNTRNFEELIRKTLEKREDFYLDIVYRSTSQLKFLRGWLYRVRRLRRKVLPCG